MLLNLDPADTYISISRTAGKKLQELGIVQEGYQWPDLRARVVGACSAGDVAVIEQTREEHFLAKATFKSDAGGNIDCVLLCCTTIGSPAGRQGKTCIIKGATTVEDADRMLVAGGGLAPFRSITK